MFIADRIQVIKQREGEAEITNEMIEKLDQMLTEYGVQHFFSLPKGDNEGIALDDDEILYIYYDRAQDEMTFNLVYMLWAKTVRNVSDERILKWIKNI